MHSATSSHRGSNQIKTELMMMMMMTHKVRIKTCSKSIEYYFMKIKALLTNIKKCQ